MASGQTQFIQSETPGLLRAAYPSRAKIISQQYSIIPILRTAFDLLEALHASSQGMRLRELIEATGAPKTTAYSVLQTFVFRGYAELSETGEYRLPCVSIPEPSRKLQEVHHQDDTIPVVLMTFDVLQMLHRRSCGMRLRELEQESGIPQSTLYRIVRTCVAREYLREIESGIYGIFARDNVLLPSSSRGITTDRGRYHVSALMRTCDVLEAVRARPEGILIRELERTVSTSRSTLYRILRTCVERGYIQQNATGRYELQQRTPINRGDRELASSGVRLRVSRHT
ncbi:IclR helix-turn-helix domain-containing protein [Granulicella rosea]|uniref:IclR helix-turn-helix domain-containing protein n=1 Tax=Granulicella rosea TaxID=474952 RepID=A0A239K5H3_9BACT|nr:helix-turn-helix domain-containing protein [Granulicella rosea]SNT12893.1 IclR helix-turn-helix domain-containing protein [Granulicella rosea]